MKKFYLYLILALLINSTALQAQPSTACGEAGVVFTINELNFAPASSSSCEVTFDVTIVGTELGDYRIKLASQTIDIVTVEAPGIFQYTGNATVVGPCIGYAAPGQWNSLRVVTPSGVTCNLSYASLLPVKLIYFTATEENGAAVLRWATASEVNNAGFYIEHAGEDDDWTELGFVEGVGTTEELQNYDFTAPGLAEGQHYFRLRQVDFDGRTEYSPIAELYLENPDNRFKVFPNPLKRGAPLTVQGSFEQIEVYTAAGQRVLRVSNAETFNNPQFLDLPAGYYHLLIQRGGEVIKEKLVVQ